MALQKYLNLWPDGKTHPKKITTWTLHSSPGCSSRDPLGGVTSLLSIFPSGKVTCWNLLAEFFSTGPSWWYTPENERMSPKKGTILVRNTSEPTIDFQGICFFFRWVVREKRWLEHFTFVLGFGNFSGANCWTSGGQSMTCFPKTGRPYGDLWFGWFPWLTYQMAEIPSPFPNTLPKSNIGPINDGFQ